MLPSLISLIKHLIQGGLTLEHSANVQAAIHHLIEMIPEELRDEAIDHIKAILDSYKFQK